MTHRSGWSLRAVQVALLSLAAFAPARASASPLFELVGSGVGSGGLNARATGASAASVYFNPSLLPKAKQGLDVGWLVLNDAISISLDARARGDDVPLSAVDRVDTDQPPVPTTWLEEGCSPGEGRGCVREVASAPRQEAGSSGRVRGYQLLGLVNHILGDSLSLGLYALVPLNSFTQAHSFFVDEREQFFGNSLHPELYADRLTPVSLAFGLGSRVWRRLYLGLSFTLGLTNRAVAGAYVGNSRLLSDTLHLSTKVDVKATVSPHFALTYEPTERSSLSATVHSPQRMEIDTQFGIYLPNGDVQYARRVSTHAYLPWIAALAGSFDLAPSTATVCALAGTVTFERWSRYLDRQGERPSGAYAWRDLITGALGLHIQHNGWSANADVSYRRSPVPAQTGRTNYVDNDRISGLIGTSYELPIERFQLALRFGAQAQVHVLPERRVRKFDPRRYRGSIPDEELVRDEWPDDTVDVTTGDPIAEASGLQTNNPGWPGFRSSGFITGGGLTFALLY